MQVLADAVADVFAHDAEIGGARDLFDGRRDVREVASRRDRRDAGGERRLGLLDKFDDGGVGHPHHHRPGVVAVVAAVDDAAVEADDIAEVDHAVARNPVYHLFVHRDANASRIPMVAEEGALDAHVGARLARDGVDLARRHAGGDNLGATAQKLRREAARLAEEFKFPVVPEPDHAWMAAATADAMASASPTPLIFSRTPRPSYQFSNGAVWAA